MDLEASPGKVFTAPAWPTRQSYGVAKRATLVAVVMADNSMEELLDAIGQIVADLRSRPDRRKRSVVTMSMHGQDFIPGDYTAAELYQAIGQLMGLDVPMVVPAGNGADKGHPNVDHVPAAFAEESYPLIVAGLVNASGDISQFSQTGPEVTLYAVGEGVQCIMSSNPVQPPNRTTGTSTCAPMIAGEIANLLSYDTVPFNISDGALVKNLPDYLVSDAASWEHKLGARMLWNGVTQANIPPK